MPTANGNWQKHVVIFSFLICMPYSKLLLSFLLSTEYGEEAERKAAEEEGMPYQQERQQQKRWRWQWQRRQRRMTLSFFYLFYSNWPFSFHPFFTTGWYWWRCGSRRGGGGNGGVTWGTRWLCSRGRDDYGEGGCFRVAATMVTVPEGKTCKSLCIFIYLFHLLLFLIRILFQFRLNGGGGDSRGGALEQEHEMAEETMRGWTMQNRRQGGKMRRRRSRRRRQSRRRQGCGLGWTVDRRRRRRRRGQLG